MGAKGASAAADIDVEDVAPTKGFSAVDSDPMFINSVSGFAVSVVQLVSISERVEGIPMKALEDGLVVWDMAVRIIK